MHSLTTATACFAVRSFAIGVSKRSNARPLVVDLVRLLRPISSTSSKASRKAARVSASNPARVSTCSGNSRSREPKRLTLARIGARERDRATHERNRGDAVPGARHDEHGLDLRVPLRGSPTSSARVPSSSSSAVGTLRVPSLSLSRSTLRSIGDTRCVIASLDVEHREPAAARPPPSGRASVSAICEVIADVNHFLPYSRQPSASVRSARVRVVPTSDPPVDSVIHWPLVQALQWVPTRQARHGTLDQWLVPRHQERARRPIGHRERTGIDIRRRMKKIDRCELMDARITTVRALIRNGDQTMLRGQLRSALPQRRDHDLIDAIAPRVPLHQPRLVQPILQLQLVKLAARKRAELVELRFDISKDFRRQRPCEVLPQKPVVAILIAETRWGLNEDRHCSGAPAASSAPASLRAPTAIINALPQGRLVRPLATTALATIECGERERRRRTKATRTPTWRDRKTWHTPGCFPRQNSCAADAQCQCTSPRTCSRSADRNTYTRLIWGVSNRLLKKSIPGLFNVACPSLMKDTGRGFRGAPEIKHIERACHLR